MRKQLEYQRSESFAVAALLAVSGGMLDAYTYLCRGGVFANAQTGNIVLLAVRLAEGKWGAAAQYLVPVGAFALGVLVAEAVKSRQKSAVGMFHWRHTVLGIEIVLLMGAAWAPVGIWDSVVNILVSFVCALQVEAFRRVRGRSFASTMCTGNLRSGTEALYHWRAKGDPKAGRTAACYFGVIVCFASGAALGGLLLAWLGQWTILTAVLLQGAAFIWMCGIGAREPGGKG